MSFWADFLQRQAENTQRERTVGLGISRRDLSIDASLRCIHTGVCLYYSTLALGLVEQITLTLPIDKT